MFKLLLRRGRAILRRQQQTSSKQAMAATTTTAAAATTMEDFEGVLKIVRCMQSWRDHEEVQEKGACRACVHACMRTGRGRLSRPACLASSARGRPMGAAGRGMGAAVAVGGSRP